MQISLTFRNTEAEDWLKDHVHKRLQKLNRYIDNPVEAHVILSVEKFRNVAEINLLSKGMTINGKEEEKDMIAAVDNVIDKIERQLKKHKDKIRNHKENSSFNEIAAMQNERAAVLEEDEDQPKVVEVRRVVLQPMSVDDAILEIEDSKNRFVMYRDLSSERVNVIYRRDDGNYVLIEANS
ncbi:MAG: ribosome-associated translation inhibitor RaiA [Deltaproteobacteria bacterium]|nr:ribosome-associated translation inhibitor RaiA [Deltaproteobacteria bacterium]MBN2687723.1 ribosome-associated translation inhibitor RaiA [Deltaproteobacteria bacterium]